jgi:hypothetical protein
MAKLKIACLLPESEPFCQTLPDHRIIGHVEYPNDPPLSSRSAKASKSFDLIVTTVNRSSMSRSPNYIHECLTPLMEKDVHVLVDGQSTNYIGECPENIKLYPLTDHEAARENGLHASVRGAINYCRCLMFSGKDVLILEDDVVLDDGWEGKLSSALSRIPEELFILALWHPWDGKFRVPPQDEVTRMPNNIIRIGAETKARIMGFACTQAVYYPRSVLLAGLPGHLVNLQTANMESIDMFYDLDIGKWCWDNDVSVYLMTPPIARHVGTMTSIERNKK